MSSCPMPPHSPIATCGLPNTTAPICCEKNGVNVDGFLSGGNICIVCHVLYLLDISPMTSYSSSVTIAAVISGGFRATEVATVPSEMIRSAS